MSHTTNKALVKQWATAKPDEIFAAFQINREGDEENKPPQLLKNIVKVHNLPHFLRREFVQLLILRVQHPPRIVTLASLRRHGRVRCQISPPLAGEHVIFSERGNIL